jgi:quercetin dioxygenase-like cupin family protein
VRPFLELIPDYVLGALPAEEQSRVHQLVSASPELQREVDRVTEALACAAETVAPLAPPPSLRARLLGTVTSVDRFAPFVDDLTRLFELPATAIRKLLERIDGAEWEHVLLGVPLHGCELFHFPVGPRLRETGGAGGVLRVRAGATFPQHRHHGDEVTYVLEGGYLADGRVHGPGSAITMSGGTAHDYQAAPERDLVIMVLHRGITLLPQA